MRRGDEDGVEGEGAFGADEEGVEVEALDGGGGMTAKAREEGVGGYRLDHGPRFGRVEEGGAEGDVLEGFDEDAADPEHDDQAEDGVALHAEDGLNTTRDHVGGEAAVDRRVRVRGVGGGEDLFEGGFRGGAGGDAETDASDVAHVEEVRRHHL